MAIEVVNWEALKAKEDMIEHITRLIEEVGNTEGAISGKLYARCLHNIVVFRSHNYLTLKDPLSRRLHNRIKILKRFIARKGVNVSLSPITIYSMQNNAKIKKRCFSLPRNPAVLKFMMAMENINTFLASLEGDRVHIPAALRSLHGIVRELGFESVSAGLEYINSPIPAVGDGFDVNEYKRNKIHALKETIMIDDRDIIVAFRDGLIEASRESPEALSEYICEAIPNLELDMPDITPFDYDGDLMEYAPPGLDVPPSPNAILDKITSLRGLTNEVATEPTPEKMTELRSRTSALYVETRGFIDEFKTYFTQYFSAMTLKKAGEEYPAADYALWKQGCMESVDEAFATALAQFNSVKTQMCQLATAAAIGVRAPSVKDQIKEDLRGLYRNSPAVEYEAVWASIEKLCSRGGGGTIKDIMHVLMIAFL